MDMNANSDDTVLLTIQNSSKPEQIVYLVVDKATGYFRTNGLKDLFGVNEIRVETNDLLKSLPEYAQVLSFIIETMSAAADFKLPYSYQNEFEYANARYSLYEENDYRVLRRVDNQGLSI